MQKFMWVAMLVIAVVVGVLTFTSPNWSTISLTHALLLRG